MENLDNKERKLLKFNYGFQSRLENTIRVLKTDNPFVGLWCSDWGEDPNLQYNGTEWTSFYYFEKIKEINKDYDTTEFDAKVRSQEELELLN